ncbi:MAG: diguanylate cyclase, partial [Mariprofundaceae bacterium]|nr:diguanylate cyclase [Mariprofundaceae bacterium]
MRVSLPQYKIDILVVMPDEASPLLCPKTVILKQRLEHLAGISCHVCHDIDQAMSMIKHYQPVIIFQTMHMHGAHGLDMLRSYQQTVDSCHIPVFMMDMRASSCLRDYAFQRHIYAYTSNVLSEKECLSHIHQCDAWAQLRLQSLSLQKQLTDCQRDLQHCQYQLKSASSLDALTALPNRHHFMAMCEREWARALRETEAMSLMLIDIDHFSTYNGCYGYQKGDQCLKEIGELVQTMLQRPTDLCGRYSGASLMVLLPMTPAKGAIQVAERIRHAVIQLHIPHQDSVTSEYVTVSIGLVTTCPMLKHRARDMIRTVERATFDAKQQG